jgi:hypothetical protein
VINLLYSGQILLYLSNTVLRVPMVYKKLVKGVVKPVYVNNPN